ncbi:MAG: MBL fold metallo-hydrolase [Spirochaetales bacterium]|nr:MBL fold metallo-hydrolase [Spirochaetales bacterium]
MKIKIVSEGSTKLDYLRGRWGLSFLIDDDILFDTFCDPDLFKHDLIKSNVDIQKIQHVIISHDHWDHKDGLWYVLENNHHLSVYVCRNSDEAFKKKISGYQCRLIEVEKPMEIKTNVFTTGEIPASYKSKAIFEQSLVINNKGKITVVTGCSHPGIISILDIVRNQHPGKIELLIGGLHLMDKSKDEIAPIADKLDSVYDISSIIPLHCTGKKAIGQLRKKMPQKIKKLRKSDRLKWKPEKSIWETSAGNG